jgi:coenzyme F420-dependent glucose-6-phosphate dehydrogenase
MLVQRPLYALVVYQGYYWCGLALAWGCACQNRSDNSGTRVTAPILRYNPEVVAQLFAMLGYMFPGRIFLGLGRGESLNEVPAGTSWPSDQKMFKILKKQTSL